MKTDTTKKQNDKVLMPKELNWHVHGPQVMDETLYCTVYLAQEESPQHYVELKIPVTWKSAAEFYKRCVEALGEEPNANQST